MYFGEDERDARDGADNYKAGGNWTDFSDGGSAGGGSQLTAEGADLLHCYQQMEKEVLATAKESFERCMARYLQLQPAEPEEK